MEVGPCSFHQNNISKFKVGDSRRAACCNDQKQQQQQLGSTCLYICELSKRERGKKRKRKGVGESKYRDLQVSSSARGTAPCSPGHRRTARRSHPPDNRPQSSSHFRLDLYRSSWRCGLPPCPDKRPARSCSPPPPRRSGPRAAACGKRSRSPTWRMPPLPFPAGVPSAPAAARRGPACRIDYGRRRASGGPIHGPCPSAPASGSRWTVARPTCLELPRPPPAETHRAFKPAETSRVSRRMRLAKKNTTTLRSSIGVDARKAFDHWWGIPESQIPEILEILETRIPESRTPERRWRRCRALYAMHTVGRRRKRPRHCEVLVPLRRSSKHFTAKPGVALSLRSACVARTTAVATASVLSSQYGD